MYMSENPSSREKHLNTETPILNRLEGMKIFPNSTQLPEIVDEVLREKRRNGHGDKNFQLRGTPIAKSPLAPIREQLSPRIPPDATDPVSALPPIPLNPEDFKDTIDAEPEVDPLDLLDPSNDGGEEDEI